MAHLIRLLLALITCGWVLPAWLAVSQFVAYVHVELAPRLSGGDPVNSFPFLPFVQRMLAITAVWLALVVLFWAWKAQGARAEAAVR